MFVAWGGKTLSQLQSLLRLDLDAGRPERRVLADDHGAGGVPAGPPVDGDAPDADPVGLGAVHALHEGARLVGRPHRRLEETVDVDVVHLDDAGRAVGRVPADEDALVELSLEGELLGGRHGALVARLHVVFLLLQGGQGRGGEQIYNIKLALVCFSEPKWTALTLMHEIDRNQKLIAVLFCSDLER